MVGEDADGHEVQKLDGVPDVEVLREAADEVSANEDIHNAAYEGYLLSEADGLGVIPLPAQLLHTLAHSSPVAIESFIGRGDATSPFFNHALACQRRP